MTNPTTCPAQIAKNLIQELGTEAARDAIGDMLSDATRAEAALIDEIVHEYEIQTAEARFAD